MQASLVQKQQIGVKMTPQVYQSIILLIIIALAVIVSSCYLLIHPSPRIQYTFRLSIKNTSTANIDVNLVVGKIPHLQARMDEFEIIPDEIYAIGNPNWSNDRGTHRTIKPTEYNQVVSFLPIGLGNPLDTHPIEYQEKYLILYEALLNQVISFMLTISKNGNTIYKIVGWDLPAEDIAQYQINDTLLGYYITTPENYIDSYGNIRPLPLFFSKLIDIEDGYHLDGAFTFYIKSTASNTFVQELNLSSTWVNEDDYWKKH